jgi:hypothetical protein
MRKGPFCLFAFGGDGLLRHQWRFPPTLESTPRNVDCAFPPSMICEKSGEERSTELQRCTENWKNTHFA